VNCGDRELGRDLRNAGWQSTEERRLTTLQAAARIRQDTLASSTLRVKSRLFGYAKQIVQKLNEACTCGRMVGTRRRLAQANINMGSLRSPTWVRWIARHGSRCQRGERQR